MSDKFQNKYRTASARLQTWDYAWDAAYFVTICTKNREHYFGEIENEVMNLSGIGIIADVLWQEIKNHAKNIQLGEFTIMPNHIHGIVILDGNDGGDDVGTLGIVEIGHAVETGHALSLPPNPKPNPQLTPQSPGQQRFQNPGKNSLSTIIGSYKSAVTNHAHRLNFNFEWQTRFHDHIIRDDKSFQNISAYIKNNVQNWSDDRFFPSS